MRALAVAFRLAIVALVLGTVIAPDRALTRNATQRTVSLPAILRVGTPHGSRPSTSSQLIDAALARGEIDAETALTYKVFVTFTDARLPARFRGDDHLLPDSHILDEVRSRYAGLSPTTQATLDPFLVPPIYIGSWVQGGATVRPQPARRASSDSPTCAAVAPGWSYKDGLVVRIWWHTDRAGDEAAADGYLAAAEGTIWPRLIGLMGRQPKSDAASPCNGGDGKFDIYLEPTVARSTAPANSVPGCKSTPAYILLNPSVSAGILAHEFMHAIQWGYATSAACMYPGEYAWLAEATAVWAQDYTYPTTNEEHYVADWFFVDNAAPPLELRNDAHEYGAYMFFFYLTHKLGDNALVRRTWDFTESVDSLEAVNKAIPGGYEAVWSDFASDSWNAPPFDYYKQWDAQVIGAKAYLGKALVSGPGEWQMTSTVPHLGLLYKHYQFSGVSARLVTFFNGQTYRLGRGPISEQVGITTVNDGSEVYKITDLSTAETQGAKVQALFRLEGDSGWQVEDWTGRPHVSFCRDAKSERLAELVIVFSNSNYSPRSSDTDVKPQDQPAALTASDVGCWRFGGSATSFAWGQGDNGYFEDTQSVAAALFERMPNEVHPNIPYPFLTFRVIGGQYNHEYTVTTADPCYGHAADAGSLSAGASYGLNNLWTLPGVLSGDSMRRYLGYANAQRQLSVTVSCPDGSGVSPVYSYNWFEPSVLGELLNKRYIANGDGTLTGSDEYPIAGSDAQIQTTWNLVPLREP